MLKLSNRKLYALGVISSFLLFLTGCSVEENDSNETGFSELNDSPDITPSQVYRIPEQTEAVISIRAIDRDGIIESYSWEQKFQNSKGDDFIEEVEQTGVEITGGDTNTISFITPSVESEQTLRFDVTVTDDRGATTKDSISVIVSNVEVPVLQVVDDITTYSGDSVELFGSATDSSEISEYKWRQPEGQSVLLSDETTATTTFTAPTFSRPTRLRFELVATNLIGAEARKTVQVFVLPESEKPAEPHPLSGVKISVLRVHPVEEFVEDDSDN